MRHRADTRYKYGNKHRGKTFSRAEVARRKAQSRGWHIKQTLDPEYNQQLAQNTKPKSQQPAGDTIIVA